jgi:hypothetical protein
VPRADCICDHQNKSVQDAIDGLAF